MATIIGNGNITFGDGSIQTTKTPSNVSAFTNDSGYLTTTNMASTYATTAQAVGSISLSPGYGMTLYADNIDGTHISGGFYNCNCNC